jgi:hypothetical protein
MKKIIIYLISFSFLILLSNSNIWDNIYSQANSPQFTIPEEFKIKLLNEKDNSTMGEIYVSCNLSLVKLAFILDESNGEDSFIHLLADFNEGRIYFDTAEKCVYLYYDIVEQVSPKFLLNAYDLLSYFSEDSVNYHYIVTNPLEVEQVDDQVRTLPSLLSRILHDVDRIVLKNQTIYDKSFYVDFLIGKNDINLKSLSVKAKDIFINFYAEFNNTELNRDQFKGIHPLSECREYNS